MNENLANRALEVLNRDQDQLKGAYEKQSDYDAPDKIEKVTVTENSDGTWSQNKELVESGFKDGGVIGEREAEIEEEAEILQEFCAEIDNKIIGNLTQIDAKKREIVTLSLTAGISTGTEDSPLNFCNSSLGVGIVTLFDINEDTETVKIYTKMAGPNVDIMGFNAGRLGRKSWASRHRPRFKQPASHLLHRLSSVLRQWPSTCLV